MCAAIEQHEIGAPDGARPMQALAFDGLMGWLHRPIGVSFDTGVVLVSALGRDERCTRAPLRLFADQLSTAGFPTLRYDHRGEGDSLGLDDAEADAIPVWQAGVRAAIAALRRQAGVRRVVVGGVRLGASLAALEAEQVDGLILLAPVLDGRSWVRRLRFSAGPVEAGGDATAVESSGLYLSGATSAGLTGIDLGGAVAPRCPVFLAAQNKLVEACGARLMAAGAPISASDFPGFDALFVDAHSNEPPLSVFAAAGGWLQGHFGDRPLDPPIAWPRIDSAELRLPGAVERPVDFGPGLQGVICEPDEVPRGDLAVLFCNTGGDPRAGIGGFATSAARALAAHGAASLRFDFRGLGDSPIGLSEPRTHVFETPRDADLDAAVSLMAARGYTRVAIVGLCAGAYHAIRLAVADPRVSEAFAVSPVKLVWRKGDSLAFGRRDDGKSGASYMQALRDPKTWTRLLRGGIDVATVARILVGRVKGRLQAQGARMAGDSPLEGLRGLSARGGRVHLIMGLEDMSLDEVETWFGPRGGQLTRLQGMSVEVDPRIDHGLARRKSREIAIAALLGWLRLA